MLIYAYGQFWNPDIVPWSDRSMPGEITHKTKTKDATKSVTKKLDIDFWDARGIYVLMSDYRAIYVGKAFKTSIAERVSHHLVDRLAGRWDMYSWFSMSRVNTTSSTIAKPPEHKNTKFETINATLEALAILIADPTLNRRRESLKGAYEAYQKEQKNPLTIRRYLQDILSRLPDIKQQS